MVANDMPTLANDMISTLYTINFADFSAFFESDLPCFVNSLTYIPKESREKVLWGIRPVTDMPSFQSSIQKLLKDIRIYSNCEYACLLPHVRTQN